MSGTVDCSWIDNGPERHEPGLDVARAAQPVAQRLLHPRAVRVERGGLLDHLADAARRDPGRGALGQGGRPHRAQAHDRHHRRALPALLDPDAGGAPRRQRARPLRGALPGRHRRRRRLRPRARLHRRDRRALDPGHPRHLLPHLLLAGHSLLVRGGLLPQLLGLQRAVLRPAGALPRLRGLPAARVAELAGAARPQGRRLQGAALAAGPALRRQPGDRGAAGGVGAAAGQGGRAARPAGHEAGPQGHRHLHRPHVVPADVRHRRGALLHGRDLREVQELDRRERRHHHHRPHRGHHGPHRRRHHRQVRAQAAARLLGLGHDHLPGHPRLLLQDDGGRAERRVGELAAADLHRHVQRRLLAGLRLGALLHHQRALPARDEGHRRQHLHHDQLVPRLLRDAHLPRAHPHPARVGDLLAVRLGLRHVGPLRLRLRAGDQGQDPAGDPDEARAAEEARAQPRARRRAQAHAHRAGLNGPERERDRARRSTVLCGGAPCSSESRDGGAGRERKGKCAAKSGSKSSRHIVLEKRKRLTLESARARASEPRVPPCLRSALLLSCTRHASQLASESTRSTLILFLFNSSILSSEFLTMLDSAKYSPFILVLFI